MNKINILLILLVLISSCESLNIKTNKQEEPYIPQPKDFQREK